MINASKTVWPDWEKFTVLGDKYSYKSSPNNYLENITFQVKTVVATFWVAFGRIWTTFYFTIWSHWVQSRIWFTLMQRFEWQPAKKATCTGDTKARLKRLSAFCDDLLFEIRSNGSRFTSESGAAPPLLPVKKWRQYFWAEKSYHENFYCVVIVPLSSVTTNKLVLLFG